MRFAGETRGEACKMHIQPVFAPCKMRNPPLLNVAKSKTKPTGHHGTGDFTGDESGRRRGLIFNKGPVKVLQRNGYGSFVRHFASWEIMRTNFLYSGWQMA